MFSRAKFLAGEEQSKAGGGAGGNGKDQGLRAPKRGTARWRRLCPSALGIPWVAPSSPNRPLQKIKIKKGRSWKRGGGPAQGIPQQPDGRSSWSGVCVYGGAAHPIPPPGCPHPPTPAHGAAQPQLHLSSSAGKWSVQGAAAPLGCATGGPHCLGKGGGKSQGLGSALCILPNTGTPVCGAHWRGVLGKGCDGEGVLGRVKKGGGWRGGALMGCAGNGGH